MSSLKMTIIGSLLAATMAGSGLARAAGENDHAAHHHGHHGHHGAAAPAAEEHAHHRAAPATAAPAQAVALNLQDTALIDQNGQRQRLLSDVMGERIVVASFVYTSCTTVCPVVSSLFSQVQDKLGSLLDSEVRLISLSVDPQRDTPARLKSYAETHGARPGWVWLTGPQPEVTAALKGFGTYTANFRDHPVVVMIGDAKSGQWVRHYGFQDPEHLVAEVRGMLAARESAPFKTARKE